MNGCSFLCPKWIADCVPLNLCFIVYLFMYFYFQCWAFSGNWCRTICYYHHHLDTILAKTSRKSKLVSLKLIVVFFRPFLFACVFLYEGIHDGEVLKFDWFPETHPVSWVLLRYGHRTLLQIHVYNQMFSSTFCQKCFWRPHNWRFELIEAPIRGSSICLLPLFPWL